LRSKWLLRAVGVTVAAAVVPAASASVASAATIQGEGSTLVAPLEAEWAAAYDSSHSGLNITYNAAGSGKGLAAIGAGQVDFGASDAPLSASTTACNGCSQMPWALTATGVGFHTNGLKKLHLSGPVLAQIYLGQIKNWNDSRIKKLQAKGTHLPNLPITVFFRSDGSGDTYAFADYLSRVSGSFKSQVGVGTKVSFPTGQGAAGNSGMVSALQATNGSIAYVAVSYLAAQWPRAAALKNAAGNYETPNYGNIQNAAQSQGGLGANNEIHIVNPPKKYKIAYPISTYTYVILKNGQPNNATVKGFVQYAITSGQSLGPRLDFVPIPGFVRSRDQSTLNSVS
jgi:phosphate transport system substrate-binding protein